MEREPIDYELALRQHEKYCDLLRRHDVEVIRLCDSISCPDCCFVEDTAIVVDEVAIITSMGVASRRDELPAVATELAKYRRLVYISPPATIEGGDVLQRGRTIFIGLSTRTNLQGIKELKQILEPLGYCIVPVEVRGSLHLTTACSLIDDETVLLNPRWANPEAFKRLNIIETPEGEDWAANTMRIRNVICLEAAFPRTAQRVQKYHPRIELLDISEFRKAEAGLSCLSIIFPPIP
jgi:dimethylargininase